MLGLGWASVARGRLMSELHETAGLIIVESLMRPGCKSRTSLARDEILWWLPWMGTGPLAHRPKLMAVPETLSKRLLLWSLSGLCLEDSANNGNSVLAPHFFMSFSYLRLWCFGWPKRSFQCLVAPSNWLDLATSQQPQDFWREWVLVATWPPAHESSQCDFQKLMVASKRW